jgi:hypothetical protein
MNENPETCRSSRLEDPRTRSDFDPRHYPRIDGQESPPPEARERNDRIKLEFLAVYYGLNREHACLLELRARPVSDRHPEEEKRILQAIDQVLIVRDQLEDEYAPLGVVAEPIVNDGFTVSVRISFGNADAAGRLRSELFTITACVPVPLPEGIRFEDLPLKIAGPGMNPG